MFSARTPAPRLIALLLALAWALGAALPVVAEEEEERADPEGEAVVLEEIEVTADLPPPEILFEDPSATKETIDVEAVREQYASLEDLLRDLSGVQIVSFGGVGRTATVSLRGSTGRQVLVLLDGVPLNGAGESLDLSAIPLDQLQTVEVLRGSQSALYGGAAVGGVISLTTRAGGGTEPTQSLRLSLGSFGLAEATFTHREDDTLVQLGTQHSRGSFGFLNDNGTVFNPDDDFEDTRRNNESHSGSVLLSHRSDWAEGTLQTTVQGMLRQRGEPGVLTFPSTESSTRESQLLLDATWRVADWLGPDSLSEVKTFLRSGTSRFEDPDGEETGTPFEFTTTDQMGGLRIGSTHAVGEEWLWTWLTEVTQEEFKGNGDGVGDVASRERRTLAAAIRGEWMLTDEVTVVGALRGDQLSDQPDRLSPKLGVVWSPDVQWTVRANAGNGYRPPSFLELYENRGFVIGNPDLLPEVSRSLDLGATYDDGGVLVSLTAFQTETRDLIEYVQLGGFRFKPLNFGRAESRGLEASAYLPLAEDWHLEGDFTWQRVTDESGGANRQGNRIPGRPDQYGNLALHYSEGPWAGSLTWSHVGASALTFAGTKSLDTRDTWDLGATYDAGDWKLSLLAANLCDADLADLRGFPLPGRALTLAYTRLW